MGAQSAINFEQLEVGKTYIEVSLQFKAINRITIVANGQHPHKPDEIKYFVFTDRVSKIPTPEMVGSDNNIMAIWHFETSQLWFPESTLGKATKITPKITPWVKLKRMFI